MSHSPDLLSSPTRMLLVAMLSFAGVTTAQPRDTMRIDADRGSRVWIEGSSNVHDWSCRATTFDARVELDRPGEGEESRPTTIRSVQVKLAVRDLKCGHRRMDNDLYTALKATDPQKPSYIVANFEALAGTPAAGAIETAGTIMVAGVQREVSVRITTEQLGEGVVRATGSVPMLMTDFGVKPPVGLMGLIRSRNEVTVRFELLFSGRAPLR